MKKVLMTTCLLFLSFLVNAQTNFKSGYIVNLTGDTIHGTIKLQKDVLNSKICVFKNTSGTVKLYKPGKIKAYGYGKGNCYVSTFVVNINSNVTHVFAKYLLKGKKSLFYFKNNSGSYYGLSYKKDTLIQFPFLSGSNSMGDEGSNTAAQIQRGFLKTYFKDTPSLYRYFDHTEGVDLNDLIDLTKKYNQLVCGSPCYTVYYNVPSIKLAFEIQGGITYLSNYSNALPNDKLLPQVGAILYLQLPRISKSAAFKTGIQYYRYSGVKNNSNYPEFSMVTIPLQVEYDFLPSHKVRPKIDFGFNTLIESTREDPNSAITLSWAVGAGTLFKVSNSVYIDAGIDSNIYAFPGAHFHTFSLDGGLYFEL